ncbi:alpha/beta fold hydrolase [Actinomycetospora straminea]|uniref:Alpha/beta hydrolase n=1 Tax=Actinomycetospora straminea TaxID=663607 RepID=A0ABP9EVJ8_9PSEU|nr:alpha/beta fold hydrolase [Actinomycetospora straminea]MDD7933014.1 alpha/beta fold hydrolase [Actinomycetospora straminea]
MAITRQVDAGVLATAHLEDGPADGWPVVLVHGFPYDVHAYDEVVPHLTAQGARVVRPYLRGHGPTRFRSATTMRSGQQAALGSDLLALVDALELDAPVVGGYDWGGLSSCVVAALWPERVAGLVSLASYDVIDVAAQRAPADPALEHALWYQHLFQTERGRAGLAAHRRELCRMLWRQWSPRWSFDDALFDRTAVAFDNPDFVDVVVHAYRHALGNADGDPVHDALEARLAGRPPITVPAVTLDGASDTLKPGGTADHAAMFTARHEHRVVDAGHALPYEAPAAFADAVLTVRSWIAEAGGDRTHHT